MPSASAPTRPIAALAVALLVAAPAAGQKPPPVAVTAARVGLPPGTPADPNARPSSVAKFATWAPLAVDIQVNDPITKPAELVVEAPDGDDVTTTLVVPLAALADAKPGQVVTARDLAVMPYVRVATGAGETVVRVRTVGGGDLGDPFRVTNLFPAPPRTYVVLALGSKLPGFDLPKAADADPTAGFRNGRVVTAALTDVGDMPDKWIGYDAVDLVVLPTGTASDGFLRRLFADPASAADRAKRAALVDWVRRGGRLVVSAGANAGLVAQLPALQELLPFTLTPDGPSRAVSQLAFRWTTTGGAVQQTTLAAPRGGTLPVAALAARPDRPGRVVLTEQRAVRAVGDSDRGDPLVGQGAFDLGRVSVVALDLDRPPFTESPQAPGLWDWLLRTCGADLPSTGGDGGTKAVRSSRSVDGMEAEDDQSAALRARVDTFEGVSVVSFGWVALFIVLYILLIGPVEYLFLKKVLGRLELTWVTFPLIVLSVSAVAYLTAYAVKGRDLRVNKVDVVDVVAGPDGKGGRVYGEAWWTVFSPRIDTYTAAVAPAPGWTADTADAVARDAAVGWVSGPRGGRQGLVRRQYAVHVGPGGSVADALVDVPVPVWSTKSFTASWSADLQPTGPAVESRLSHPPGDPATVVGTFVNRTPFAKIVDAVALYAGKRYPLPPLLPGAEQRLVLTDPEGVGPWLADDSPLDGFPLRNVLFHEAAVRERGFVPKNASLRRLDQSWRLTETNRDEVIVVGRVAPSAGPAEEALAAAHSPTQLWLRGLPTDGAKRVDIVGTGRQETTVRFFLPVKPVGR